MFPTIGTMYDKNLSMSNSTELLIDQAKFKWDIYFIIITVTTLCLNIGSVILGFGNIATIGFTLKQKYSKKAFNMYVCAMAIGDLMCSDLVSLMDMYDLIELIVGGNQLHKDSMVWCIVQVIPYLDVINLRFVFFKSFFLTRWTIEDHTTRC